MAGDRPLRRIRRRIHDIEHQRRLIDEHVNFLSRLQEQLSSGALTPEQIPGILRSTCYIQAPDIPSALRIVARDRSRLDGEEAMLRQRASARQLFLRQHRSAMPHGTPSSLAGASSSSEIETWVPEHVVEASSSELGGTSKDPTLTLNDTPHTLESADELPEHVLEVSSSELGGTSKGLSKFETLTLNDTPHTLESAGRNSYCVDAESIISLNYMQGRIVWYSERQVSMKGLQRELRRKNKLGRFYPLDFQGSIEFFEKQDEERAQLFQARGYWPLDYQANTQYADKQAEKQTQSVEARGQHTYASKKEEVAANAKRWMSEEAMEAFRRYIESKDDLKGLDYEFGELVHQCFHVEHYFKIFHHFNFTAKTKMPGSTDWTSAMYFAQVKSICMIKRYACYPLEQDQYGECYACESQGMGELRHPLKGIYDLGRESSGECYACESQGMGELRHPLKGIYNLGREDIQPPFYYEDSDSDEFDSTTGQSESSGDDMS